MNKFNVKIWETYSTGAYRVTFIKTIELPFAPFYGLEISCDGVEEFRIEDANYGGIKCYSLISWNGGNASFVVDKSHYMDISKFTVKMLEDFINDRTECGWEAQEHNNYDLNKIKELLKRKEESK